MKELILIIANIIIILVGVKINYTSIPTTTLAPIPLIFFCDAKGMKGGFSTDTISPVQGLVAHQIPAEAEQPQAES